MIIKKCKNCKYKNYCSCCNCEKWFHCNFVKNDCFNDFCIEVYNTLSEDVKELACKHCGINKEKLEELIKEATNG